MISQVPYSNIMSTCINVYGSCHLGMAHFTEHMLFLGSRKYPKENSYKEYLSKHGGSSNGATGMEYTSYFFSGILPSSRACFESTLSCPIFFLLISISIFYQSMRINLKGLLISLLSFLLTLCLTMMLYFVKSKL